MYRMYQEVRIPGSDRIYGTGWLPPLPDLRDYTESQPEIAEMATKLGIVQARASLKSETYDTWSLRDYFSPVEDQGNLWILHCQCRRRNCRILSEPGLSEIHKWFPPVCLQDHPKFTASNRRQRSMVKKYYGSIGIVWGCP